MTLGPVGEKHKHGRGGKALTRIQKERFGREKFAPFNIHHTAYTKKTLRKVRKACPHTLPPFLHCSPSCYFCSAAPDESHSLRSSLLANCSHDFTLLPRLPPHLSFSLTRASSTPPPASLQILSKNTHAHTHISPSRPSRDKKDNGAPIFPFVSWSALVGLCARGC